MLTRSRRLIGSRPSALFLSQDKCVFAVIVRCSCTLRSLITLHCVPQAACNECYPNVHFLENTLECAAGGKAEGFESTDSLEMIRAVDISSDLDETFSVGRLSLLSPTFVRCVIRYKKFDNREKSPISF